MRKCGKGNRDRLENVVVAECNIDEVVVVFGAVCGEFLGGVIFAVYDTMTDVFFKSGDVLEVVKGLVVEEVLM